MSAANYIAQLILMAVLVIVGVVALNYVVDPYGVAGAKRIAGFNQFKVDSNAHTRLLKKYQPGFSDYDTLIVGNSRVEMGLDPRHSCFVAAGKNVYNLGIPGAQLATQFAYTLNVVYQQQISHVFLGVDFTDFIGANQASLSERPLYMQRGQGSLKYFPDGSDNPQFWMTSFQDYLKSLFSIDALGSSLKTVATQSRFSPDRTDAGFNPGQDFAGMVRFEGPRALFDQKLVELQAKYSRPWYFRDAQGQTSPSLEDLARFIDVLLARGIAVTVFSNPLHEQFWEVMEQNGHIALYQDWQKALTNVLRQRSSASLAYWDFAADSPYIHESVPGPGMKSGPLDWFWEPAHYRRELGDLMLETMLAQQCGTSPVFGRKLL